LADPIILQALSPQHESEIELVSPGYRYPVTIRGCKLFVISLRTTIWGIRDSLDELCHQSYKKMKAGMVATKITLEHAWARTSKVTSN